MVEFNKKIKTLSKASLAELQNQIIVCKDLDYLKNADFDLFYKQSITVDSLIAGMQKSATDRFILTT